MSIATLRGDSGQTDLLYSRRVSKCDSRILANAMIDELNARLGTARALLKSTHPDTSAWIHTLQNDLFTAMGEVAVHPDDFSKHQQSNFPQLTPSFLENLNARLAVREPIAGRMKGWAVPGESLPSAALHLARTACRQAEISLVRLHEEGLLNPAKAPLLLQAFNRLSDLLWIEARLAESPHQPPASC